MGNDMLTGFLAGQSDNNNGGNNGGFFGNEGLWAVIILAIIFGWGNNGNGFGRGGSGNDGGGTVPTYIPYPVSGGFGFGGSCGAVTQADLCQELNSQGLQSAVRGVQQGLCDGFYVVNTSLLQGFNGNNTAMMQGFSGVDRAVCTLGYQTQAGFNALGTQMAQCCCDTRAALADLKYDMATSDCSIKTLINQLAQQIMWGQQNGIRDLSDLINNKFCQLEMSQKDAIIADLRTQLAQCGDQNMANAIVARLTAVINPPAVPSYPAANPNGCGSWPANFLTGNNGNSCGCNQGCSC